MNYSTTLEQAEDKLRQAKESVQKRLPEFAAELIEWDAKGTLIDGVVSTTAEGLASLMGRPQHLAAVRAMVYDEALRQAVSGAAKKLSPSQAKLMASLDDPSFTAGDLIEFERGEFQAAKGAAALGLLTDLPEALAKGQMHFEGRLTTLGQATANQISPSLQ